MSDEPVGTSAGGTKQTGGIRETNGETGSGTIPGGPVSTDVGEAALEISIRGAKGHLRYAEHKLSVFT